MSQERTYVVHISKEVEPRLRELQDSAAACLRRYESAMAGDETEVARYQQIQAEIEAIASAELLRQAAFGVDRSGSLSIEMVWPFAVGPTAADISEAGRLPVKDVWRPSTEVMQSRGKRGHKRDAVTERFEAQLAAWLESDRAEDDATPPVCPSDIANRVLSESLRKYIARSASSRRVDAPVVYKDGSAARSLPLRSLKMVDQSPPTGERLLRLTLMSIRHPTVDAHVDGAWLRNREISVRRAYATTDELVYQQSREQFAALSQQEPVVIELYQTGLEVANVGFYRAWADHHLEGGGRVTVIPRYYEGKDESADDFARGTIWRAAL